MISKILTNAINEQINAELWSAYLYLSMAMDAEDKHLSGISNWFFVQWMEEQDHARIFQKYLASRGGKVNFRPVVGVPDSWPTPLEMFRETLRHEEKVTAMIHRLVKLAVEEEDFATISRLQWFIDEQVEEESSAADRIADLALIGDDNGALMAFDEAMSERTYHKASALKELEG